MRFPAGEAAEEGGFVTTTCKWILGLVLTAVLAGAGFAAWFIHSIPGMLDDLYGQWAAAELVIGFHEKHGRLPANWQDLQPIYGDGGGLHRGKLDFAGIQKCMVIEFARLGELQTMAQSATNTASVPRIIYLKNGVRSHWEGAEPNQMVYEYFVKVSQTGSQPDKSQ
jgi:hypothetical protein